MGVEGPEWRRITLQQRILGASADWKRTKFTMDADMSRAVREAFVRLYEEGLIYRDTRLIHWDCEARTVLSNLEVENEPGNGELFEFAYPVDGGGEIVVATTRPETMLGDSAIAVHPDDPRYKELHGKRVRHPFLDRTIPIITDALLVDPTFGTGAVKVTPAHDFNDFVTGKRHKLEEITVLNLDGTIERQRGHLREDGPVRCAQGREKSAGREGPSARCEAPLADAPAERTQRVHRRTDDLDPVVRKNAAPRRASPRGRARGEDEDHSRRVDQDLRPLSKQHPRLVYLASTLVGAPRPRVLLRQLRAHHRLARRAGRAMRGLRRNIVHQDQDVLDTWFSSGLWPFSTLGWPERTAALTKFYPASDLETGYDILFFWVARMMMMGIHFMGQPPFSRILLHGLVVDETGDKMSKVKGNVIDPIDLIQGATFDEVVDKAFPGAPKEEALKKFKKAYPSAGQMGSGFAASGADALRYTLATYSPQAKRIPLSPKKLEGYRNFCNKIWNATRYALGYLDGAKVSAEAPAATLLPNRWILARLSLAIDATVRGIEEFRLDEASLGLYHFFWGDLCDWFVEITKPIFAAGGAAAEETRDVLAYVLETSLRLLHPFIPFITEELWQRVPRPAGSPISVALAPYPDAAVVPRDEAALRDMAVLQAVITAARTIRSEHDLTRQEVPLTLRTGDESTSSLLHRELAAIRTLRAHRWRAHRRATWRRASSGGRHERCRRR